MTTAITTTIPSDSTTLPEAHPGSSTGRRFLGALAAFTVGASLGWVGATVVADDTSVPAVVPAAVVVQPEATPSAAHVMSADAAARWAEVERQERLDRAECRRLSVGTSHSC